LSEENWGVRKWYQLNQINCYVWSTIIFCYFLRTAVIRGANCLTLSEPSPFSISILCFLLPLFFLKTTQCNYKIFSWLKVVFCSNRKIIEELKAKARPFNWYYLCLTSFFTRQYCIFKATFLCLYLPSFARTTNS
jgi:hypothetical protein